MKKIIFSAFVLLLMGTACQFQDPEFVEFREINVLSAGVDSVILEGNCVMYNPNRVGLDLTGLEFDLRVNEQPAGKVMQTFNTQMPARSEFSFPVRFSVSPKAALSDGNSLLNLVLQTYVNKSFDLHMNGEIKAGLKGVYYPIPFEHTEKISLQQEEVED